MPIKVIIKLSIGHTLLKKKAIEIHISYSLIFFFIEFIISLQLEKEIKLIIN